MIFFVIFFGNYFKIIVFNFILEKIIFFMIVVIG